MYFLTSYRTFNNIKSTHAWVEVYAHCFVRLGIFWILVLIEICHLPKLNRHCIFVFNTRVCFVRLVLIHKTSCWMLSSGGCYYFVGFSLSPLHVNMRTTHTHSYSRTCITVCTMCTITKLCVHIDNNRTVKFGAMYVGVFFTNISPHTIWLSLIILQGKCNPQKNVHFLQEDRSPGQFWGEGVLNLPI